MIEKRKDNLWDRIFLNREKNFFRQMQNIEKELENIIIRNRNNIGDKEIEQSMFLSLQNCFMTHIDRAGSWKNFDKGLKRDLKTVLEILDKHKTEKYGEIKKITMVLLYNTLKRASWYVLTNDTNKDLNREIMKAYIMSFVKIYDYDVNKASELFLYILEKEYGFIDDEWDDEMFYGAPTYRYYIDFDEAFNCFLSLSDDEKEAILNTPLEFALDVFFHNFFVKTRAAFFVKFLTYPAKDLYNFLDRKL